MSDLAIGIDIGSTSAKTVVMDGERVVYQNLRPTGWSSVKTADVIRADLEAAGFDPAAISCVSTGYGRAVVPYAARNLTEISCHGRGAAWLFQEDPLLVIDMGGQDTKLIRVQGGKAQDFLMNDKCSAGTGRFLEVMGNSLGLDPRSLCDLSASGSGVRISSLCTVFAETEITGLIGRGEPKENIAFAIVESITDKVISQLGHFGDGTEACCLTGGLCECAQLIRVLENKLGRPLLSRPEARYAGAIGAALSAQTI